MLLVSPYCNKLLPHLPPTLHGQGQQSFPSSDSLTPGTGVHLHLAIPHEHLSKHPKVEPVFALALSGCHPMGEPVARMSMDLPWAQSHGCQWWSSCVQGSVEGLQHLGSLPCVLPHKSLEKN